MKKGASVLVTGGNGFLGKHVVALLAKKGCRISTIGRGDSIHQFPHTIVDLAQEFPSTEALKNVTHIVHAASEVGIAPSLTDPSGHILKNLSMTLNVLEACRTADTKPLVIFISSDRVYGRASNRVTEQSATFPIEPYTGSKILSEVALAAYANLFNIPYIILRPSAFFGPHQPRRSFVADIIQKMKVQAEITVGPLKGVKNFIYVENVAEAVLKALASPRSAHNQIYNIGGKPQSLLDMLRRIKPLVEKRLNKKIRIRINRSIQLPQKNDIGPFTLVTAAAHKKLKWRERISCTEGLEKTVDYFLAPENQ